MQKTLEEEQKNLEATEKEYEAEQATLTETINSKKDEITNLDGMIQEAARKAEEERKSRGRTPQTGRGSKEQCDSGTAGDTFQSE